MSEYVEALHGRVRRARLSLALALEEKDAYAVAAAQDELDDAVRLARSAGVDVGEIGDEEGARW
ncbi:hypothetical protein [Streptomyces sp. NPDC058385]|uniref:hypothetical protein n=1 Tax=Streptomyces sp. NPDC058385 TaxID=3346473 RepID=UPI003655BCED